MNNEQKFRPETPHEPEALKELERFVHSQFQRLPEIEAPPTLIPRVLAAVRAKEQRAWWQRSWFDWPAGWQIFSLAFLLALPAFVFVGSGWAWDRFQPNAPDSILSFVTFLRALADIADGLGNALFVTLRSLEQPWVLACTGLMAVMYLTCIGLGTACVRVAIGKPPLNIRFK